MGGGPGASGPSLLDRGFATYGSDSGHQAAFGGPRGGAPPGVNVSDDWVLNDEAIRNLGYMQMKKTHDAAMVIMVTMGTNDTLASPGAQLDYFQSIVDRMGRANVDQFARFFVMPQTGHGLSGTSYGVNGDGKDVPSLPIPNRYDQLGLLFDWVENNKAPGMSVTVTADERSLPLCSYPSYPRYRSGAAGSASSYECSTASPTTK
jgi:hypothetical protein